MTGHDTMTSPPLRIWMGWISIAALALLAAALQIRIAPVTGGFLPQTSPLGYSGQDLARFFATMADSQVLAAYRALLVWGDTVTVVLFAAWIVLSFTARIGAVLAGAYLATEIAENAALLVALHGAVGAGLDVVSTDMALAGWFTIAKFAVALPIVATILWREIRGR